MLGENIRKIRKAQKISINKLSKETGISLGYLSELENGKAKNQSLDNTTYCVLDLETTGISFRTEKITEVGIMKIQQKAHAVFRYFLCHL